MKKTSLLFTNINRAKALLSAYTRIVNHYDHCTIKIVIKTHGISYRTVVLSGSVLYIAEVLDMYSNFYHSHVACVTIQL